MSGCAFEYIIVELILVYDGSSGCILQIQQLSERSLLLVYSIRFIVDLKVCSNHR